MNIGMLWFDGEKTSIEDKVKRAADYCFKKYHRNATVCYVHPSMLSDEQSENDNLVIHGIEIIADTSILPNHFWIGRKDVRSAEEMRYENETIL